ncbi:MAG: hypothetical protein ABFD94_18890 [Armatimonadia bacterium]
MPRKLPTTPRSRIRNALRMLWMRSRERGLAVKAASNTCMDCGRKGSKAIGREVKIEVHHRHGIDWDGLIDLIAARLLQQEYDVLCSACHEKRHAPR